MSGERPKRRRLPGITLKPGSVKQARVEARLSLAQVGKGHVTAPAIYLIETGRTRPSLPTLEHIAKQTGKPVEFFLAEQTGAADEGNAAFLQLEAMVEDHQNEEAIALGLSLLERAPSAYRLGRIRYLLAHAYAGTGQRQKAASLLSEAKRQFEAVNASVMLAACLMFEAELCIDTSPEQALALAQAALALDRGLTPRPVLTVARVRGVLADAQAASGDVEGAIESYREAVKLTEPVFDLRRSARTYRALGLAFHDAGEIEKASRYAMRATALFEVASGRESVIRWEHRLASSLMARGDLDEARAHLDRALELLDRSGLETGRGDVLLGFSDLALRSGDADQAAELASQALAHAERVDESATAAEAHVRLGQIADRRGDLRITDAEFEQAITGFETLNMRDRLLHAHSVYAEVLERRGEHARAYEHMKRALRVSLPASAQLEHGREGEGSA